MSATNLRGNVWQAPTYQVAAGLAQYRHPNSHRERAARQRARSGIKTSTTTPEPGTPLGVAKPGMSGGILTHAGTLPDRKYGREL